MPGWTGWVKLEMSRMPGCGPASLKDRIDGVMIGAQQDDS